MRFTGSGRALVPTLALLCVLVACSDDDATPAPVDAGPAPEVDAGALTEDAGPVGEDAGPRPPPFEGPTGMTDGCGAAAESGLFPETIDAADFERSYQLIVPEGYDESAPHALVFLFHGAGDSATNLQRGLRFESVTDGDAIVVYPQGRPVLAGNSGWELEEDTADTAFFDALFADLSARFCVDRARVFAAGFSYGGFFSNLLGCIRGDVLRAIAPVSAAAPSGECVGQAAAWIAHGTADGIVPFVSGSTARRRWRSRNGCSMETEPTTPTPCVAHLGCDEGYPLVWCEHPGGHGWPSFGNAGIWEFFTSLD